MGVTGRRFNMTCAVDVVGVTIAFLLVLVAFRLEHAFVRKGLTKLNDQTVFPTDE